MFKKNDIAARIVTTVQHFGWGSGREPVKHHDIHIVRVASAAKDGRVKSYQTRPGSPEYKTTSDCVTRIKWLAIGGDKQAMAARLFDSAQAALVFDNQEACKDAIRNA